MPTNPTRTMTEHTDFKENSTEAPTITEEERVIVAAEWGLTEEVKTTVTEAVVEDFRIRPYFGSESEDEAELGVTMRISGEEGTYYLDATVTYVDGSARHCVNLRPRGGETVHSVGFDSDSNAPSGTMDAVSEMHDVYVQCPSSWYQCASAAETAGED